MMVRRFGAEAYWGLKTAVRKLIAGLGGIDAAACESRVTRSLWGAYGNPNSPRFPPIDVVLDAEAECGRPFVTEALARLHGYMLVPMVVRGKGEVREHLARFAEEAGGTIAEGCRALADEKLTAEEIESLVAKFSQIITVSNDAVAVLNSMRP